MWSSATLNSQQTGFLATLLVKFNPVGKEGNNYILLLNMNKSNSQNAPFLCTNDCSIQISCAF